MQTEIGKQLHAAGIRYNPTYNIRVQSLRFTLRLYHMNLFTYHRQWPDSCCRNTPSADGQRTLQERVLGGVKMPYPQIPQPDGLVNGGSTPMPLTQVIQMPRAAEWDWSNTI